MRTETLFLAATFASLITLVACGDKDGDETGTADGGTADGGTGDGGTTDGGTGDGGTGDGGTGDGGTGDGGTGDGGTGDGGGDGGGSSIDCKTAVWDELTGSDRGAYMAECVMPTMQPIFQGYDATAFADFSCASCHGADFNGGTYGMPNAVMLDYANSDEWPDGYAEFMGMEVMPAMAELLGTTIFNPKTNPEGFQCNSCHK